jgi:hypothetical protein
LNHFLGWPWTLILLILAVLEAGITDMNHQWCPARIYFSKTAQQGDMKKWRRKALPTWSIEVRDEHLNTVVLTKHGQKIPL